MQEIVLRFGSAFNNQFFIKYFNVDTDTTYFKSSSLSPFSGVFIPLNQIFSSKVVEQLESSDKFLWRFNDDIIFDITNNSLKFTGTLQSTKSFTINFDTRHNPLGAVLQMEIFTDIYSTYEFKLVLSLGHYGLRLKWVILGVEGSLHEEILGSTSNKAKRELSSSSNEVITAKRKLISPSVTGRLGSYGNGFFLRCSDVLIDPMQASEVHHSTMSIVTGDTTTRRTAVPSTFVNNQGVPITRVRSLTSLKSITTPSQRFLFMRLFPFVHWPSASLANEHELKEMQSSNVESRIRIAFSNLSTRAYALENFLVQFPADIEVEFADFFLSQITSGDKAVLRPKDTRFCCSKVQFNTFRTSRFLQIDFEDSSFDKSLPFFAGMVSQLIPSSIRTLLTFHSHSSTQMVLWRRPNMMKEPISIHDLSGTFWFENRVAPVSKGDGVRISFAIKRHATRKRVYQKMYLHMMMPGRKVSMYTCKNRHNDEILLVSGDEDHIENTWNFKPEIGTRFLPILLNIFWIMRKVPEDWKPLVNFLRIHKHNYKAMIKLDAERRVITFKLVPVIRLLIQVSQTESHVNNKIREVNHSSDSIGSEELTTTFKISFTTGELLCMKIGSHVLIGSDTTVLSLQARIWNTRSAFSDITCSV